MDLPLLRIARQTGRLREISEMYQTGLGFEVLGGFEDHDGYDGVFLGIPGGQYHLEFISKWGQDPSPPSTDENLMIFYHPDRAEWESACSRMAAAGFVRVGSGNPYWDRKGRTFEDLEGYRVTLYNDSWPPRK